MKIDSTFAGSWVTEDEDSDVEFIIDFSAGVPSIQAYCLSDREQLDIIDLRIENDTLSFDSVVPSTGYRVKNKCAFSLHIAA